jgi:signal transduction histidine kinase
MSADTQPVWRPELAELAESGLLAASLFHEIRQPLFVLKGLVDLAISGSATLGAPELELLRQELRHVEALVEHYAALQPQPGPPLVTEVTSLVRVAVEAVSARARQAGVTVRLSIGTPVDAVVRPVAVRQVVANLTANAIDAAADGDRAVEVLVRAHEGMVEIEVTDGGPGIDPRVSERLGEPFLTTKGPGSGTGLGVFVTRGLVREWGGSLRFEAGPGGRGTRATVTLPVSRS